MFSFRSILFLTFILCSPLAMGQGTDEEKTERAKSYWSRFNPDQAKFQFAGSMGMFSIGPGLSYGEKLQWETDLFIGFIPQIDQMKGHITLTLKQTYTPFRIELNDKFTYEPLTAGIYMNKIFGSYFWERLPSKYPKNYYFWSTNTRFNVFLGQTISFQPSKESPRNWSFFYEVNTNDLYILSAYGNNIIDLTDIINISFGLRYRFNR